MQTEYKLNVAFKPLVNVRLVLNWKHAFIVVSGIFLLWQLIIWLFDLPPFILPSPVKIFSVWMNQFNYLLQQSVPTILETIIGLVLSIALGMMMAIAMTYLKLFRQWFGTIVIISQAIPVFALAPLFVLWFGYGMLSKIAITTIMLFFPIASAFADGLRRTEECWLELAKTMNGSSWSIFRYVRIPAALPALASGIRVATAMAPLGAVIGEWVGASRGLGFLILNANAKVEIDLMFAALFTLVLFTLTLYYVVNKLLLLMIPWDRETLS